MVTLNCRQEDSNFPVAFRDKESKTLDEVTGFKNINMSKELVEVGHITGHKVELELNVHCSPVTRLALEK